ncbi:MAG: hypothetical protein ACE145_07315 [Terriglobia bacterium]
MGIISRLAAEPPFRLISKVVVKTFATRLGTLSRWDAVDRPHYLFGLLHAAAQTRREGKSSFSAIEFGVAEGYGLLALQAHSAAVTKETGIGIDVFGFDTGSGLPKTCGDYRDHPDHWQAGDFQMDIDGLRRKLLPGTELVIGNVASTVLEQGFTSSIGFISFDLDFYSSTIQAFRLFSRQDVGFLRRVGAYFDDINDSHNHSFAGELLAIDEFNGTNDWFRIDPWRGIRYGRPFPEAKWLDRMFLIHNLKAISATKLNRMPARLH